MIFFFYRDGVPPSPVSINSAAKNAASHFRSLNSRHEPDDEHRIIQRMEFMPRMGLMPLTHAADMLEYKRRLHPPFLYYRRKGEDYGRNEK